MPGRHGQNSKRCLRVVRWTHAWFFFRTSLVDAGVDVPDPLSFFLNRSFSLLDVALRSAAGAAAKAGAMAESFFLGGDG